MGTSQFGSAPRTLVATRCSCPAVAELPKLRTKLDVDAGSGTLFWSGDKGCELARVKTRRVLIASVHPTQLENQEVTGASCRNQRVGRRSDSARPLAVMAGESAALSGGSGSSVGRSHGRKRSRGPSTKLRPSSICANTSDIGVQQPEKVRQTPCSFPIICSLPAVFIPT